MENNKRAEKEGNGKQRSHAKGQPPNLIVVVRKKDRKKSKKKTSQDQWRSRKYEKNEGWYE